MSSMWNAPSDRDYYALQHEWPYEDEEYDEPEWWDEEYWNGGCNVDA